MAHAGGRPSKYKPEYVAKVAEYIETTGREQTSLPTIQGFAVYIGVWTQRVEAWAKKFPKFRGALKKLKAVQAEQLINDGIYGGKEVNSTIVKLMLMNNHGMREKTENDNRQTGEVIVRIKKENAEESENGS